MKQEATIAIVPGSFDPITVGHLDIIRRAAEQYGHVYVAVMINPKKQYRFTLSQRTAIAQAAVRELTNVSVIASEGMLWELARDLHACALVKGYRNEVDWQYEQTMAAFNQAHYPDAETVLLPSKEAFDQISSTVVRERIRLGQSLQGYVPQAAIDEIYKIIPRSL